MKRKALVMSLRGPYADARAKMMAKNSRMAMIM